MTYEQYWDGDPALAIYYRKADEIRYNRRNHELWLQGLYVYEAILDASPILQAFAKKGTKARPFATRPYAMTEKQKEAEKEAREREAFEQARRYMESKMAVINPKFKTT